MTTMLVEFNKCRVCGCTELNPCLFRIGGLGEPLESCAWFDFDHTLCTNPRCVAAIPLRDLERMCAGK
jgi:hypothetical protein